MSWHRAARWLGELAIAVALACVLVLFVYQPVRVEGTSMLPALVDSERLFINKYAYRVGLTQIERGDLIVFQSPREPARSFIKRVIGLAGDTVEVRAGAVWLNGRKLDEPYVPEEYRDQSSMLPVRVPSGHYFVMGDHRSSSNDSRGPLGPICRESIYGKAVFAYWPLERMGRLN